MTREIAHQKSFEKALYAIADNFPPGKLPGLKPFADTYVNTSQGGVEQNGPWNSGKQWDRVEDLEAALPADGGDGDATVQLSTIDGPNSPEDRMASRKTLRRAAPAVWGGR